MIKILTIALAVVMMASLTTCSSNNLVPTQNTQTNPPPIQGITVNSINFEIVKIDNLTTAKKERIETYKTSKGFTYWQEDGYFYIAIFAGQKPSAGYTVNVKSIEDNEGKTNILVDVVGPKDMAASVISYPYIIVKADGITDYFNIKDTKGNSYSALRGEAL